MLSAVAVLLLVGLGGVFGACPEPCRCTDTAVSCVGGQVALLGAARADGLSAAARRLLPSALPPLTDNLTLSNNVITRITPNTFMQLPNLKYLDVSSNAVARLEPSAFAGLAQLVSLNLTDNKLRTFNSSSFKGLTSLTKLYLGQNHLGTLPPGSFKNLNSLTFLDLSGNPLKCDFKFVPRQLQVYPSEANIFFTGQRQDLSCHVSNEANVRLQWRHNGVVVAQSAERRELSFGQSRDKGLLMATVSLINMTVDDAGLWSCAAVTRALGEAERSIHVVVMRLPESLARHYCPLERDETDKGVFAWPRTMAGGDASLGCPHGALSSAAPVGRRCGGDGAWEPFDESLAAADCHFASPLIRNLQHDFFHASDSNVSNRRDRFVQLLTEHNATLDSTELQFAARALASLPVEPSRELHALALLLARGRRALTTAAARTLTQLRRRLDSLRPTNDSAVLHGVALCELTAEWPNGTDSGGVYLLLLKRRLYCVQYADEDYNQYAHGRLQLRLPVETIAAIAPASLGGQIWFRFVFLQSAQLFRGDGNDSNWVADSPVIGVSISPAVLLPFLERIDAFDNGSLSSSAVEFVYLQLPVAALTEQSVLAVWNESAASWQQLPFCAVSPVRSDAVSLVCPSEPFVQSLLADSRLSADGLSSKFTYFTLLQLPVNDDFRDDLAAGHLKPWMLSVCGLFVFLMVVTAATTACCHSWDRGGVGSVKLRHCLVNSWLSMSLLCLLFSFGIDLTAMRRVCLAVSVALHYLSLVALVWSALSLRTVQRKWWKARYPLPREDDGLAAAVSTRGPLVGLYFLGWVAPLAVVAFTLAIDSTEYAGPSARCFLTGPTSVYAAVALPFALVLLCVCGLLLSACCLCTCERQSSSAVRAEESSVALLSTARPADSASLQSSLVDSADRRAFHFWCSFFTLVVFLGAYVSATLYVWRPAALFSRVPVADALVGAVYSSLLVVLSLSLFLTYALCRPTARRRATSASDEDARQYGCDASVRSVGVRSRPCARPLDSADFYAMELSAVLPSDGLRSEVIMEMDEAHLSDDGQTACDQSSAVTAAVDEPDYVNIFPAGRSSPSR